MNRLETRDISAAEWEEIASMPAVREGYGLTDERPEEFASRVYGAKFDFVSGGPGYVGDLYVLQDDALAAPPLVFRRRNGKLELIEWDEIGLSPLGLSR